MKPKRAATHHYTQEELECIRVLYQEQGYTLDETVRTFNQLFNTQLKDHNIQKAIRRYGFQKSMRVGDTEEPSNERVLNATPEHIAFIEGSYRTRRARHVCDLVNDTFGTSYTLRDIKCLIKTIKSKEMKRLPSKNPSSPPPSLLRRTYREFPNEWAIILEMSMKPWETWTPEQKQRLRKAQLVFGFNTEKY